eukprot:1177453-Prorocentrum_minimum.AAC.2
MTERGMTLGGGAQGKMCGTHVGMCQLLKDADAIVVFVRALDPRAPVRELRGITTSLMAMTRRAEIMRTEYSTVCCEPVVTSMYTQHLAQCYIHAKVPVHVARWSRHRVSSANAQLLAVITCCRSAIDPTLVASPGARARGHPAAADAGGAAGGRAGDGAGGGHLRPGGGGRYPRRARRGHYQGAHQGVPRCHLPPRGAAARAGDCLALQLFVTGDCFRLADWVTVCYCERCLTAVDHFGRASMQVAACDDWTARDWVAVAMTGAWWPSATWRGGRTRGRLFPTGRLFLTGQPRVVAGRGADGGRAAGGAAPRARGGPIGGQPAR